MFHFSSKSKSINQMSNSQLRDPAIKLFGRSIPLSDSNIPAIHRRSTDETKDEDAAEKSCDHNSLSGSDGKSSNSHGDNKNKNNNMNGRENEEAESGKERAAKRLIPCPRCNSSETKFCYFNNYNVNQPRHFCRNCHRYWTAGGTIRNVPVGAGRRRNPKPSPTPAAHHQASSSDPPPLCDSMESKLSLGDGDRHLDEPSPSSSSSESSHPVPQWAYPGWNFVMVRPNNGYPGPGMALPGFDSYWGYMPVHGSPTPRDPGAEKSCVWVPKTLRIDDLNEAVKSSIWSTLGIEHDDKNEDFKRSGVFKPFKRKSEEVDDHGEGDRVLKSNPAALSRSNSFQESM